MQTFMLIKDESVARPLPCYCAKKFNSFFFFPPLHHAANVVVAGD